MLNKIFDAFRGAAEKVGDSLQAEAENFMAYDMKMLCQKRIKESLNNVAIPSNRTLNFNNSALDFQDEAGFA